MPPVYLYTAEVYPTQVRGLGLALTATAARFLLNQHQRHQCHHNHHNHPMSTNRTVELGNLNLNVNQYWWVCFHFPLKCLHATTSQPSYIQSSRIGGFVAPFIAGLGVRDPSLPFLIFGGAAVVSIIIIIIIVIFRMGVLMSMVLNYNAVSDDNYYIHQNRSKSTKYSQCQIN